MANILVVAEHDGSHLNPSTAKCVACAAKIDGANIDVAVLASAASAVATDAARLDGVGKILTVENAANEHALAAVLAPQIAALADGYTHVFGPSTTFGKDLMPRVAALLGVNQISDVMSVVGPHTFKRPIYAGNAIVTVEVSADHPVVATVRTASYKAVGNGNSAAVESSDVAADIPTHTRFVGVQSGSSGRPDLQTAAKVVSGGRALASAENFDLIYALADKLGAGVGASRAAVDAGYVPNEMQVGQTGKIIAPDLYIAIGISGAIQHLTGIKDAGTIVAINKDEEAPIFEVADIGLVADLFKVVQELTDGL
jgi:electron transfer flavoprotein alpha subunit